MRIVKAKNNFFDYQELRNLVELCEDHIISGYKNIDLNKALRNADSFVGSDPETFDPSKIADVHSGVRKKKERENKILSYNRSLFNIQRTKEQCLIILENIKILDKQINLLDNLYNQVIRTYTVEDGRWAANVYVKSKKSKDSLIKSLKTKEEKSKYDNFKKFFNTLSNIKVSTSDDKVLDLTIENILKYCKATINKLKVDALVKHDKQATLVRNRYIVAYQKLSNTLTLIKNINMLISKFTNFNLIVPINSGTYNNLINDLNKIVKQILLNLKDIMGDSFKED